MSKFEVIDTNFYSQFGVFDSLNTVVYKTLQETSMASSSYLKVVDCDIDLVISSLNEMFKVCHLKAFNKRDVCDVLINNFDCDVFVFDSAYCTKDRYLQQYLNSVFEFGKVEGISFCSKVFVDVYKTLRASECEGCNVLHYKYLIYENDVQSSKNKQVDLAT